MPRKTRDVIEEPPAPIETTGPIEDAPPEVVAEAVAPVTPEPLDDRQRMNLPPDPEEEVRFRNR